MPLITPEEWFRDATDAVPYNYTTSGTGFSLGGILNDITDAALSGLGVGWGSSPSAYRVAIRRMAS